MILLKPVGFPEYFKPNGRFFDLCVQGRLLILSAEPATGTPPDLTRELCCALR